jgi:hypothetical protein
MADPVLLESVAAWLGGIAVEGQTNSVSLKLSNAEKADGRLGTAAGPGDKLEAKYPGLLNVDAMVKGFYSAGVAGDIDDTMYPRIAGGSKVSWPLTICPPWAPAETPGADGNIAYTIDGALFSYVTFEKHGELLPFEVSHKARSGARIARQTIMLPKLLRTGSANGTARQLGLLGTGQKLVSCVHLFAIDGGDVVVTIESDNGSGFATPVTRVTHASMTAAPDREVIKLAGPIATDDWWRAVATYTPGTDFTIAVLLGIVPS